MIKEENSKILTNIRIYFNISDYYLCEDEKKPATQK